MSTRHADPDAPLSQERYMSSLEYTELRGISGSAVTAKAATLHEPSKRSLLFFLQAMSLQPGKPGEPGGMEKFCRDFLAMFPERIGSLTMHKLGMKRGQKYSAEDAAKIEREIHHFWGDPDEALARELRDLAENALLEKRGAPSRSIQRSSEEWVKSCAKETWGLPHFIVELCINPSVPLEGPGVGWFKDIIGALHEFKCRHEESARADFVMTEIGKRVFDTLDATLELSRTTKVMSVIEGDSGVGKTTATEAWCQCHLGETRFVSLSGISHKTGIFRAIAKALGIASSYARTATEMQVRVEDMLQKSGIMLVVDEAHFALSAAGRVYSEPEIVNWFNTALYNHRVPLCLVCTPQFLIRLKRAERQVGWNMDQLRRRGKRFIRLPAKPTTKCLEAVAWKLLPGASNRTIQYLVGYALSSKLHFPAIVDAIDEARLIMRHAGRKEITFDDVERAVLDYCAQSADAWQRTFEPPAGARRGRRARPAPALPQGEYAGTLSPAETPINAPVKPGRKTNLTGLAPARTSTLDRRSAPLAPDPDGELVEK